MALRLLQRIYWSSTRFDVNLLRNISMPQIMKCSTIPSFSGYDDKDPAPLFFDKRVQDLLQRLTGFELDIIFEKYELEKSNTESFAFFTKEQYDTKVAESIQEGKRLLQMPPVVKIRKPKNEILSKDSESQGKETANMIFTEVSYGITDRKRLIVVREPNGTLRQATHEERDRMNSIYNPRVGRYVKTPKIFLEESQLNESLSNNEYRFVLDFACSQFEPDDPVYQRNVSYVYDFMKRRRHFSHLHSTRHFGPFAFYLAWNKDINQLIVHFIENKRIDSAVDTICLHTLMHHQKESTAGELENKIEFIKKYVIDDGDASSDKQTIQMALQTYLEDQEERANLERDVKASHAFF